MVRLLGTGLTASTRANSEEKAGRKIPRPGPNSRAECRPRPRPMNLRTVLSLARETHRSAMFRLQ